MTIETEGGIYDMQKKQREDHTQTNQPWGLLSCIDLYDCSPEIIRNEQDIRQFVRQLCDLIEMKRFGETQVVHFGEDDRRRVLHDPTHRNISHLRSLCQPYQYDLSGRFQLQTIRSANRCRLCKRIL